MEKTKSLTVKIILLTRHGQRIDSSHLRNKQKLLQDDPELTPLGREQAIRMGKKISDYLKNTFKITFNENNFQLISSPFARTLQTSMGILKGYEMTSHKIKVDNHLSECIYQWCVGNLPNKYVSLYLKPFHSDFGNRFEEFEKAKLTTYNELNMNNLPTKYENEKDVEIRVNKSFIENKSEFFDKKPEIQILQFVSHAAPLAIFRNSLASIINSKNKLTSHDDRFLRFSEHLDKKMKLKNNKENDENKVDDSKFDNKFWLSNVSTDYYEFCDTDVFVIKNFMNDESIEFHEKLSLFTDTTY